MMGHMACRRCSTCAIDYPLHYHKCLVCDGDTAYIYNVNASASWQDDVKLARAQPAPSFDDEKVVNWRLQLLLEAGADPESADALARAQHDDGGYVDLHRAADLVQRAGPALAVAILT